jgi:hypothetical protein
MIFGCNFQHLLLICYRRSQIFENVAQFKHLGKAVTNQNLIQEEIKRGLNSGTACYNSVQNVSSSHLFKNVKIRIYKTIILPVVLYGCKTWSLILTNID